MGDGDRKYRQSGYQDSSRNGKNDKGRRAGGPPERIGPRSPQMVASRTVSRCSQCGAVITTSGLPSISCSGCGAHLHACTQCSFFDPGARFQCSQPIPKAVPDKHAGNECTLFEMKTTVERDASPAAPRSGDARSDLDALFKK